MKLQKTPTPVRPFAGISFVDNTFVKAELSQLIDNELGCRVKTAGYLYNDIIKNLANVFIVG
ncbi:MAG: hypothetical protein Q8908_07965 [Bacteroidota bacterium]|nr:hypothetical protein [Bacteroidota bacterium]